MIEFTTLTIISILLLIYFRPGKTPPLNNSLIIERSGQYHVTLAAQLNLAQPFIEGIAKRLGAVNDANNNSATLYFEVRDQEVTAHGAPIYLLAITQRNGILYFQATPPPQNSGNDLQSIRDVCNTALAPFPSSREHSSTADELIINMVHEIAQSRGIQVNNREPL